MRAVVFNGAPRLTKVPDPRPAAGEALVRVLSAGICNTDLEIMKGYMRFSGVLGHEFVGIVESSTNSHLQGKRMVGEINCVCHQCEYCQLEMPHHCLNRTVLGIAGRDGVFAEYVALPEENLHLVPQSIPDDVAVFTEPAAAAYRILEQVEVSPEDRVVVLGDGKLGQLIAQVLHMQTKNLMCVGKHRSPSRGDHCARRPSCMVASWKTEWSSLVTKACSTATRSSCTTVRPVRCGCTLPGSASRVTSKVDSSSFFRVSSLRGRTGRTRTRTHSCSKASRHPASWVRTR